MYEQFEQFVVYRIWNVVVKKCSIIWGERDKGRQFQPGDVGSMHAADFSILFLHKVLTGILLGHFRAFLYKHKVLTGILLGDLCLSM
jgi:hypothetical protein